MKGIYLAARRFRLRRSCLARRLQSLVGLDRLEVPNVFWIMLPCASCDFGGN